MNTPFGEHLRIVILELVILNGFVTIIKSVFFELLVSLEIVKCVFDLMSIVTSTTVLNGCLPSTKNSFENRQERTQATHLLL